MTCCIFSCYPVDPQPAGTGIEVGAMSARLGPRCAYPWHRRRVLETWNASPLARKEPERVQEVEQYQLDIVLGLEPNSW